MLRIRAHNGENIRGSGTFNKKRESNDSVGLEIEEDRDILG